MFFSSLLPCQFVAKKSSERLGDRGCLMAKQGLFAHQTAPVCPPNRGCWQTNGVFIAGPCISCSDRLCGGTPADDGPSSITTAAPSYTPKLLTVSAVRQSDGRNHKKNVGASPVPARTAKGGMCTRRYAVAGVRAGTEPAPTVCCFMGTINWTPYFRKFRIFPYMHGERLCLRHDVQQWR